MSKNNKWKEWKKEFKELKKKVKEGIKEGSKIDEDEMCIAYAINPTRFELEPKPPLTAKELQIIIVKRMDENKAYKRAYGLFNIWIDEEKNRVILSR